MLSVWHFVKSLDLACLGAKWYKLTDKQIDRQTNIATYRLYQNRGHCCEKHLLD